MDKIASFGSQNEREANFCGDFDALMAELKTTDAAAPIDEGLYRLLASIEDLKWSPTRFV